jgi:hypothetical protein
VQLSQAGRQATGPYFAVRATGTPDAIERADRMYHLLLDAGRRITLTKSQKVQPASDPKEWADLLAGLAREREAFVESARKYLGADRR